MTIDDDLADSLKEQARQQHVPFKRVVNDALRRGLSLSQNGDRTSADADHSEEKNYPENDPKYYKRILDEEDIQHYLRVRDDIDATNLRRIEEVVRDQETIERFHRPHK